MQEKGPIYGVNLLAELPLINCGTMQALPSRADLESIQDLPNGTRIVGGYEVLLEHYRRARKHIERLQAIVDEFPKTEDGITITPGMPTWCSELHPMMHLWDVRLRSGEAFDEHCKRQQEKHFSTYKAALAAREGH